MPTNSQKIILITGGAGFIGSHFVRLIFEKQPNWKIIVLDALTYAGNPDNIPKKIRDSKRFQFWYGSVTQPILTEKLVSTCDYIVHFAAETHVARSIFDNSTFFHTDVIGTQVIANAALENKNLKKFIHISTSEVYGTAETQPMTEAHPLNPTSPYAAAKCGADRLIYSYIQTYRQFPALIIRPFNNYGPNQHLEKLIPRFITNAFQNKPLNIHGDGHNSRDWIYVKDTCEGIYAALRSNIKKTRGEIINLGSGKNISILEIAKTVLKIMKKSPTLIQYTAPRPGEVKIHHASTKKAQKILGFQAATSFSTGIKNTIDWYCQNRPWWEKQQWMREVPIALPDGKIVMY